MRALVVLALLASCADLPPFEAGVCGNFVIDPGEDCDDASAACQACALHCTATPDCPDGYACGADKLCHAPSGVLAAQATGSVSFSGTAYAVTDIDRDGYGDVVGLTQTSLTVTFGDPTGSFTKQQSTLTPVVKGAGAFARFDDDQTLDVVLPTADGVAAYTSPKGALAPHEFAVTLQATPSCQNQLGNPFFVYSADDHNLVILTEQLDHKLGLAIVDSTTRSVCPQQVQSVCSVSAASPIYDAVQIYDTTSGGVPSRVISVVTGGPGGGLCVVNLVKQGTSFAITTITPPVAFTGLPTLVDLTPGGGCPSLIDSSQGPASLREYRGGGVPGACTLAASATALALGPVAAQLPATTTAIGHVTLSPPLNDGKVYGKDALALSSGIYAVLADRSGSREMYRSDRELGGIGQTDIDNDGDIDAVAARPGFVDGDVLLRASNTAFLLYRFDTVAPVTGFLTGDFDGNGIGDLAYIERHANGDHLMVAFGTPDRPLPAVDVGTFTFVVGLVPLQLRDSNDPFGIVDDMAVFDVFDQNVNPRITFLHGSPQRSLLAFFDPRPVGATSTFAAVAAGNYVAGDPTDVLAVELPHTGTAMLWPLTGTGGGSLVQTAAKPSAFESCTDHPDAPLCGDTMQFVDWPLPDRDVVIAIDDSGVPHHVAVIDPASWVPVLPSPDPLAGVPAELALRTLHAVDIDGDGRKELVISFGVRLTTDDGSRGAVMVCDVDDGGVPTMCDPIATRVPELAGATCVDATPANLRPRGRLDPPPSDPAQDLAVLCHAGARSTVFHVYHDGAGFHAQPLRDSPTTYEELGFGDVTGDGVDDLVVFELDPTGGVPHLVVIPQCAASDLACRGAAP